jgi:cysteinyl-tRNA synthetase
VNEINQNSPDSPQIRSEILKMLDILGFKNEEATKQSHDAELIELLMDVREDARKDKNYRLSDKIRDRLKDMKVILSDSKEGVKWKTED